ncbi:MAG: glycosyl hydrolase 53 family protein [Chitinispirillaceae bacterium]|nr:glycosyl hydrolase 53 family protein [Chitinispirillaceae bacterium]
MNHRSLVKLSVFLCLTVVVANARERPYLFGADISWNRAAVASGQKYNDGGTQKALLPILKEHGFNWIRLRMFVDPTAVVPETSESPYSRQGECDLAHTVEFAKYIKAAGFKFLLDFHYSDVWADPGKQYKPMSWRNLSYRQLVEKVRSYTRESLEAFEKEGVVPEMVQVGNEIVGGMIWPDGKISNMSQFAELINAGIDGVEDVSPDIEIMIHNISSHVPNTWLKDLNRAGVTRIDVYGLSYYEEWHGTAADLKKRVEEVAANHNVKIALAEYSDNHRQINDIIFNLPGEKGLGTFVWEPTRWGDEKLFDGTSTNQRMDLFPLMVKAYGNDVYVNRSSSYTSQKGTFAGEASNSLLWFDARGQSPFNSPLSTASDIVFYTLQGRLAGKVNKNAGSAVLPSIPVKNGMYIIRTR